MNLDRLRRDGICPAASLSSREVGLIRDHLATQLPFDGHVAKARRPVHAESDVTCWGLESVITAPILWELALTLTPIAGEYLQQDPICYSIHAFTTFPSSRPLHTGIQAWHRDQDDEKFVGLFVYLTDVQTKPDGPHQFQIGTHRGGTPFDLTWAALGPAGTTFLADTSGLHRGLRPTTKSRTLAWIRWGISQPPNAYLVDRTVPVDRRLLGDRYPADPRLQRAVSWLVRS